MNSILKAFHLSGFLQLKKRKAGEMGHESNSRFWTVEMAAGSAFQVSFRFGGDSLGLKMLKRFLLFEGMVGFPSHPRTMSSWPLDLACSFDNVSL